MLSPGSTTSMVYSPRGMTSAVSCTAGRGDGLDPSETPSQTMPPGPKVEPGPQLPGTRLTGKVVAPEGTIPIAGALVYLAGAPPAAIPDGVYCDKCVHLPDGTAFTTTRADGTFELEAGRGSAYLVVQKGAFRRVRSISLAGGTQPVPAAMTTLPAITDKAAGDDVPKIAVLLGAWDPIELVLARMGLKATITKDFLGKAQVLSKDAPSFAIYGAHLPGEVTPYPAPITLLTDPKEISKYHIVFIPCSGTPYMGDDSSAPRCSGVYASSPKVKTTLNEFVQKGGRLYASDWSYEYVRQVFPGAIAWRGETTTVGSEYRFALNEQQQLTFGLSGSRVRFQQNQIEDFDAVAVSAGWLRSFTGKGSPLLQVSGYYSRDEAERKLADGVSDKSKRVGGLRTYYQYSLSDSLSLFNGLGFTARRDQSAFARATEIEFGRDRMADVTLGVNWKFQPKCSMRAQWFASRNDSNIAIYDYTRNEVSSNIRCDFM